VLSILALSQVECQKGKSAPEIPAQLTRSWDRGWLVW